jgi:hypothetical protein
MMVVCRIVVSQVDSRLAGDRQIFEKVSQTFARHMYIESQSLNEPTRSSNAFSGFKRKAGQRWRTGSCGFSRMFLYASSYHS